MDPKSTPIGSAELHQLVVASSDSISAILRRVRVRAIVPRKSFFTAPWAVQLPGHFGGFFAAVQGTMYLTPAGGASVLLRAGEIGVLLRRQDHVVSDPLGTPAQRPEDFLERREMRERRGIVHVRGEPTSVHFAGWFVEMDGLSDAMRELLPPVVVLRSEETKSSPYLAACFSLLEATESLTETRDATADLTAGLILLAGLHRALEELREQSPAKLAMLLDPHIGPVVKLMCDYPDRDWSMRNLAEEAGLSRTMFHERFVAVAEEPPMRFLRRLRLAHGRQLFQQGLELKAVARRAGYASPSAFAAAYRRAYGSLPA